MPFVAGQQFPGETHQKRFEDYVRWREILRGNHAAAWNAKKALTRFYDGSTDYMRDPVIREMLQTLSSELSVVANLPRVIERKFASLTIRGFRLAVADDDKATETLASVLDQSGGWPLLHRCAYRLGGYGNAILTARRGDDGKVILDARDPWAWFPETDPADASRVLRHVFAWRYVYQDIEYLMQEIREPGKITRTANQLHTAASTMLGAPVTWESLGFDPAIYKPEEALPTGETLVAVWRNVTDEESIFGDSDLLGNEPAANEVTARLSQISRILDQHADPKMQGPASALRTDPNTGKPKVEISGARFWPRENADDPSFEYVTWDAQLAHAFEQYKNAIKLLCIGMEMSPALLGMEEGAGVEATETLRLRAVSTVDAVEAKRQFATAGIKEAARLVLMLSGAKSDKPVTVEYADALPPSRTEVADQVQKERLAGLLSRKRAIKKLNPEMSDKDVDLEDERLQAEEAGALNPGMA